jgi:hypothetical protein
VAVAMVVMVVMLFVVMMVIVAMYMIVLMRVVVMVVVRVIMVMMIMFVQFYLTAPPAHPLFDNLIDHDFKWVDVERLQLFVQLVHRNA